MSLVARQHNHNFGTGMPNTKLANIVIYRVVQHTCNNSNVQKN